MTVKETSRADNQACFDPFTKVRHVARITAIQCSKKTDSEMMRSGELLNAACKTHAEGQQTIIDPTFR